MTMVEITVGTQRIRTAHKLHETSAIHGHGTITRTYESLKATKAKRRGCRDDYYNHGGTSNSGECWGFSTAKVVDKVGPTSIYVPGGPDGIMTKTQKRKNAFMLALSPEMKTPLIQTENAIRPDKCVVAWTTGG